MTLKDRLGREKDTLGLYLTGHPIDIYREELKHIVQSAIGELRAGSGEQTMAGLIIGIRSVRDRKGDNIYFLTLDDPSGRVDVRVTGELYAINRERLQKDLVIVVCGTVSKDDYTEGIRIRAKQVLSMVEARARAAKKLMLNVDQESLAQGYVEELTDLLTPYRRSGEDGCPVAIEYCLSDARAEVVLGDEWRVLPDDDLMQSLRDHYGSERVYLHY